MTSLTQLHELGQSTWLNYLRNSFIRSGELRERIDEGIQGLTANALVYEYAIAASGDYDDMIRREVAAGSPVRRIHEALIVDDLQRAADVLRPLYEASDRKDGFASIELDPAALQDVTRAVAEVRHLGHRIDRYNVMIEIPATPVGVEAVRRLIEDGVCVNATHIFSVEDFERVAQAYISGLETYIRSHSVWRINPTAVASFSLSPIDGAVDPLLEKLGRDDLKGKTAIALARVLYARFREIFSGPRWEKLAGRGALVMRPKWTRTTPRDFAYSETHYVEALIGPDTVMTFAPVTLNAFRRQGRVAPTLTEGLDEARAHLAELADLGIDLGAISEQLHRQHLAASDRQFQALNQAVMRKRDELDSGRRRLETHLGPYRSAVETTLQGLCRERIVCRIWAHDHTVWKPSPTEIRNRLGWLHVMTVMGEKVDRLEQFTQSLLNEGFTHALLLGMGGSSLAPELFHKTFGKPAQAINMPFSFMELTVLDTTDADAVRAVDQALDLRKTLVIVATKSGGTVETLSAFNAFYNRALEQLGDDAGRHFIAITDPGSKLVEMAQTYGFRDVFLNDPNIGGRYSALSHFGLLPAALVGVDLRRLLDRAGAAAANAVVCDCEFIADNDAAVIGATIGQLALQGRDKLTFIASRPLSGFGDWVEQLIAESTGKERKGILPVVGEPPGNPGDYGDDRLFVHLRLNGDTSDDATVKALAAAGHPLITVHLHDVYDIGAQFFTWEMATAVAGHLLQINPFDQPNVEAAKVRAREMMAVYRETGKLPQSKAVPPSAGALAGFLAEAKPGDYVALQAYVTPTPETDEALQTLRLKLRERTKLATTAGYGPRFLHSTGQLHKGDAGNGLFIQLVSGAVEDVAVPDKAGEPASSATFDVIKQSQALGDAAALHDARRRVISFDLGTDVPGGLRALLG